MKKVVVLLSGSGVFDGSEIQESVFTLLALNERNIAYQCAAPNRPQMHVLNHLTGEEMPESRNILIESARIARGEILDIQDLDVNAFDGIVVPGGFGAAKNLNEWAVHGPDGKIHDDVKQIIQQFHEQGKAICGLCMGPTVIAQALANQPDLTVTVGDSKGKSPYDIGGIGAGIASLGVQVEDVNINGVCISKTHKVVTAPCYMMEGSISDIKRNVDLAMDAFHKLLLQA